MFCLRSGAHKGKAMGGPPEGRRSGAWEVAGRPDRIVAPPDLFALPCLGGASIYQDSCWGSGAHPEDGGSEAPPIPQILQPLSATARLERFWRTLKEAAKLKTVPPLIIGDLERRLETTLTHYLCFRPHQALHGATPAEAFLGREPACLRADSPPRALPGDRSAHPPFTIDFLDSDRRVFPILKKTA